MRISRHQMWMQMAEVAALRSTCYRGNTGAILIRDNNPVGLGYNGPPSGDRHCRGNDCELTPEGGCARSLHAERNTIERANLASYRGCILYTVSAPCTICAAVIIDRKIQKIFYRHPYRDPVGLKLIIEATKQYLPIGGVWRITPSGMIIDEHTGQLIDA